MDSPSYLSFTVLGFFIVIGYGAWRVLSYKRPLGLMIFILPFVALPVVVLVYIVYSSVHFSKFKAARNSRPNYPNLPQVFEDK